MISFDLQKNLIQYKSCEQQKMNYLTKITKSKFAHSSKAWFKQHVNDEFVKKANQLNYRSRAAFKLEQIQQKYNVLGQKIIDLGSAPGSWSEYSLRYKKDLEKRKQPMRKFNVVAVDVLDMKPIQGVDFYKCDARDRNLHQMFREKYGYFDSIISDMAPNFSGVSFQTHQQIIELNKMCVKLTLELSHIDCSLVMKTTEGVHSKIFFEFLELIFQSASRFKPKASRSESKQFYLVCQKLRKQFSQNNQNEKKINEFVQEVQKTQVAQTEKQTIQNTKKLKLIQFIDKEFSDILVKNEGKKINRKELQNIIAEATK